MPVLTSTTVIASVRSMTSEPPEGSHTLRSMALAICSSMRYVGEGVGLGVVVLLEPLGQVGRDLVDVRLHHVPRLRRRR